MSAIWLYARLTGAVWLLLVPGWLIARALGVRGVSAALAWALVALGATMGVVFLVSTGLWLALVLLLALSVALVQRALARASGPPLHGAGAVAAAGGLLGLLLWRVAGEIGGDGFFHLARVRKLVELGDLSLGSVNEFPDGGLHPGYAYPLWHGFLALVARLAGADPGEVVLHAPSVLVPIAALVAYEAARLVFGRTVPALVATAAGVAIVGLAPGHGGAFTALALPATSSRQLLVPAATACALAAMRRPGRASLATAAAASLALAIVHPTYALFLWIPFAGFVAVRAVVARREALHGLAALAALVVPGALFFCLLVPVIGSTVSVSPDTAERERAWRQYAGQLDGVPESFAASAGLHGRAGAVAVAALVLLPFAALAMRRRWAAFAVGGALAVFVATLLPFIFTPLADLVSVSQARRLAGFIPFGIALAGGAGVLAALIGRRSLAVAAVLGTAFLFLYTGDFDYMLDDDGPAWATWLAVVGTIAAVATATRGLRPIGVGAGLVGALFLLPTFVYGFTHWTPSPDRPRSPLSGGLVESLRRAVPEGATVYADPEASYRIGAAAPVYVCVAPPGHVADTEKNRPRERVIEFRRFARTGDLAIPEACGAQWLVVDTKRFTLAPQLDVVYEDARWRLYRL